MIMSINKAKKFLRFGEYLSLLKLTKYVTKISVADVATDFDYALRKYGDAELITKDGINFIYHGKIDSKMSNKPKLVLHSMSSDYRLVALVNETELYIVTNRE